MDANRELFHKIFVNMNLPSYIEEDFIYDVFENVLCICDNYRIWRLGLQEL